jgi:hypothetical protein
MELKARMRRAEKTAEEEMIVIPPHDGTVRRFGPPRLPRMPS